jgi:hypothetical protein
LGSSLNADIAGMEFSFDIKRRYSVIKGVWTILSKIDFDGETQPHRNCF